MYPNAIRFCDESNRLHSGNPATDSESEVQSEMPPSLTSMGFTGAPRYPMRHPERSEVLHAVSFLDLIRMIQNNA